WHSGSPRGASPISGCCCRRCRRWYSPYRRWELGGLRVPRATIGDDVPPGFGPVDSAGFVTADSASSGTRERTWENPFSLFATRVRVDSLHAMGASLLRYSEEAQTVAPVAIGGGKKGAG